jgi:hypothetical protein
MSKVMTAKVGELSAVDAADLQFGAEWGRSWESWVTIADLPQPYRAKPLLADSFLVVAASAGGKPTGCRALRPSSEPALDALGCKLLVQRAAFRPLYAGPAQPVDGRWVVAIRWKTEAFAFTAPPMVQVPYAAPPPGLNDHVGWPRLSWRDSVYFEDVPDAQAAYRAPAQGPKAGRVSLDLITDPQAGIVGCEIGVSSGSADLDQAACALTGRIRLRYHQPCETCYPDRVPFQVLWGPEGSRIRLPLASPSRHPKPAAGVQTYVPQRRRIAGTVSQADFKGIKDLTVSAPHLLTRVAVDAEGRPKSCTINRSSGNTAIDARACALMVKRIRYSPRTDVFGDPAADTVPGYMSLTAQP